jgi:D-alanyl-D-alanine carboxypeptidase
MGDGTGVGYHPSRMSRATRRIGAWALALTLAILFNASIALPAQAPSARGGASSAPAAGALAAGATPASALAASEGDGLLLPARPIFRPLPARPQHLAPLSHARAAELQAATERARYAFGLYSLAVGISIDGTRGWTGASGTAADGFTTLTGDTPFAIGSISKTFTASIVLQLVEEGKLRLHQQVRRILPEAPIDPAVTVAELLHHTSGIADLFTPLRDELNADPARRWFPDEVVGRVANPWFAPGAGWAYSNTNYVLLGMIIERVTGHRFVHELAARLTGPLALDESGMEGTRGAPYLLPTSWASAFWSAGAMYASPRDLLRWGDALYAGTVLRPGSLHRMLSFNRDDYGLGAERVPLGDQVAVGHSGLLHGYTSLLVHLPDRNVTLVVVAIGQQFDPARLLADGGPGRPSILELALAAGERGALSAS